MPINVSIGAKWANRIWIYSQFRAYKQFLRSCKSVIPSQEQKLAGYLSANADTLFGKEYGFASMRGYGDFARQLPIQEWEDIQPWVERISKGEKAVLTADTVLAFEETSGSTSASKLIPYTSKLKQEFETGIAPWMVGLYRSHPSAFDGPSYWSISPATKQVSHTTSGIPIGLEDDTEYFSPLTRYLLKNILAIPGEIKNIGDPHQFYLQTLVHLLSQERLSFVSVWSPSFCLQLDQFLQDHIENILARLHQQKGLSAQRMRQLNSLLGRRFCWKDLWPDLSVVSCWTDAQSSLYIPALQKRIGQEVPIQAKGLLATEGICSIPLHPQYAPVLTIQSHFYEFRQVESGDIFRAHELTDGQLYELILTTAGGLYRYATGDLIEINGFFYQAPCFRFVGRKKVSDLVGEKLSDYQVNEAIQKIFGAYLEEIRCLFLYPRIRSGKSTYVLFLEPRHARQLSVDPVSLLPAFEQALAANPYFAQAIQLGQLQTVECQLLDHGFSDQLKQYLQTKKKIKDGDWKMPALFQEGSLYPLL
ncbi:MAG: GH3 auxin-responsive promoter family protein [Bacteroidota bacterium]